MESIHHYYVVPSEAGNDYVVNFGDEATSVSDGKTYYKGDYTKCLLKALTFNIRAQKGLDIYDEPAGS